MKRGEISDRRAAGRSGRAIRLTIVEATARDKDPLVRSVSLQALAEIGRSESGRLPDIITAMTAALGESQEQEAVVKQAALEGLAALGGKVTAQRQEVIKALARLVDDRNPQVAYKARQTLTGVYQATPEEMEAARRAIRYQAPQPQ